MAKSIIRQLRALQYLQLGIPQNVLENVFLFPKAQKVYNFEKSYTSTRLKILKLLLHLDGAKQCLYLMLSRQITFSVIVHQKSYFQIFMAAGCELEVAEVNEKGAIVKDTIQFDSTFFTGYRKNVIAPYQVLVSLKVPYTQQDEYFASFKQARRREDDIAIVNAAFFFKLSPGVNFTNILQAAFSDENVLCCFSVLTVCVCNFLAISNWQKSCT